MKEMKKTIEELKEERSKLYDKIYKIDEQIRQKKLDSINLDLEGKYTKYTDTWGVTHYCYVTTVMSDNTYCQFHDKKIAYLIRGHGFDGEFTGYGDATDFYWSYWYEYRISSNDADDFIKDVNKIEIITKEEFDNEFNKQISLLLEFKKKYKEDITNIDNL